MTTIISGTNGINKVAPGAVESGDLPAGTVLQVVQGVTETEVSSTSSSYADTNLTASITPSSTSSKILILVSQQMTCRGNSDSFSYCSLSVVRNSTTVAQFGTAGASRAYSSGGTTAVAAMMSLSHLDSPATTSSVTYKTQFASMVGVQSYVNNSNGTPNGRSVITLMEIAQ